MKFIFFITLLFLNFSVRAQPSMNPSPAEYQRWLIGPQIDVSKEQYERYNQNSRSNDKEDVLLEMLATKMEKQDHKGAILLLDLMIANGYKKTDYYYTRGLVKTFLAYKNNSSSKTAGCSDFRKSLQLGNPAAKKAVNEYCLVK
jgi:hypothetical protein